MDDRIQGRSTFRRAKTPAEYEEQIARADAEIARLRESLKTPFGAPVMHRAQGHVLDNGVVLLRRPLFEGYLDDPGCMDALLAAMKGAKCLGFDLFEMDLVPGAIAPQVPQGQSVSVLAELMRMQQDGGTFPGEEWKNGKPIRVGPARLRIWALVVAETEIQERV